ncbi:sugar permease [Listeria ivanovii]|uniref:PTS sugar transporter subunit IIA n=1 Tax=Listeria ivanovii TaxID=1638 RepID=UPI000DA8D580|nr:PTS glucose transporter subunit IIA [Listeria ivanovii]PZF88722.1 sugar permease [Listeria ivanovii]PZF93926.1 sugar permease [Listeria ivanovii]PZG04699.1 sugar permease [Listeria ivanovii]PZG09103.1 sugar permease [Listeria ivanovii]PZG26048.1 sugar permease [Listeria ivanovii]
MQLFKKKTIIYAPGNGVIKSIEKVNDELFSTKALGDGFALETTEHHIFSPVEGTITSVFPTKHAISIKTTSNLDVLIHIGIDTVELNGEGFTVKVEKGMKVNKDTAIVAVDFPYLKTQGKDTDVMVIFTNLKAKAFTIKEGNTAAKREIGIIK